MGDLPRQHVLDAAGISRAIVLSAAYIFEQPSRNVAGAAEKLRRENEWTSRQVALFPHRLIGFCGLNPMKDYALEELARCAADPNLRRGLKLHFGDLVVDHRNPTYIEQVRRVFRAANEYRMAIVVHMRSSTTQDLPYGRAEALTLLNELLPAAPDVPVQVAHLAGGGPPDEEGALQALEVFAEAARNRDPRMRLLYFDATLLATVPAPLTARRWASVIRQIGLQHVLFGSDATIGNVTAGGAWAALRKTLPLSESEFETIATNVPPYMQ